MSNIYTNSTFDFKMLFSKTYVPSIQLVSLLWTMSNCLVSYLPDGSYVLVFVYNLKSSLEKTRRDNLKTLATVCTQDTGRRQTKQKNTTQKTKKISNTDPIKKISNTDPIKKISNTNPTKKMSITDPTKKPEMNPCLPRISSTSVL
jgi:hypothetical protein